MIQATASPTMTAPDARRADSTSSPNLLRPIRRANANANPTVMGRPNQEPSVLATVNKPMSASTNAAIANHMRRPSLERARPLTSEGSSRRDRGDQDGHDDLAVRAR